MDLKNEVADLVEQFIENDEVFLVEVIVKGKVGNLKIQVFIDGDQLVDIDECSKISRKLSNELEERDTIDGKYTIEVSSPGADKPLKLLRQYAKHIGRELEIETNENKKYQGVLIRLVDEKIELSVSSSKVKKEINADSLLLPFDEIEMAKVVIRL